MSTSIARRLVRIAVTALTAATIITVGTSCAALGGRAQANYCAIMPDSIGLYVGNPVTQMGYQIGKVTSISANATDARVDFSVTEHRSLPHDVKAVIRSTSILADRALELVGNYDSGAQLSPGGCIPLERATTPKSLSEVIGSATTFLNTINPAGSTNIGGTVRELDQLLHNTGAGANQLLTTSSALADSPDQAISDIGSIITNLAQLTTTLKEIRSPMKQIMLDGPETTPDAVKAVDGGSRLVGAFPKVITAVGDIESNLGDETQLTLDSVSVAIRKITPHANALANLFDPVPWWINTVANHINRRQFHIFNIAYRPPMFRVGTHDGLALCGFMNDAMPGSCADVHGQPYAVDVALLQYVLMQANR